jgi:hypothetical protein
MDKVRTALNDGPLIQLVHEDSYRNDELADKEDGILQHRSDLALYR